ncbi:MAG: hypothetical protein QME68_06130, partial [Elusimicrobiota bacterium]|nr:hypothetical protein [Elusimicrobiota bacterium]
MNFIIVSLILTFTSTVAFAKPLIEYEQSQATGGFPGEYLLTYAGSARGLSMGKSYTAICDGSGGVYWNPAGSVQIDQKQFAVFYAPLFSGSQYSFFVFSYLYYLKDCFGISLLSINSEKLEKRNIWGDYLGEFYDS